jgi:PAS domain S-box-containing protein
MSQKKRSNLQERKKYEALLDITGTGIFEISTKTQEGFISDTLKQILNLKEKLDTLALNDFLKCVSEANRDDVKQEILLSLAQKKPFQRNFQLINGPRRVWVKGHGKIIGDAKNEILLLALSPFEFQPGNINLPGESRFTEILNFIPTPLLIIAEDGKIRYVNKAFTDITGYSHEEIPTVPHWVKLAYGEDSDTHSEIVNQLFQINKYRSDGEFRFYTKSKDVKYLHFFTAPLGKDEDGRRMIVSIGADVTEVREKDNLLQKQAEELQVLTNRLPHLIFTANEKGQIDYLNENWITYTGMDEQELKEKGPELIHPDDLIKYRYNEVKRAGSKTFDMDLRIKNHEGHFRWLNIRAVPIIQEDGKITKWIGTGTDVHDKYIAEQKLLQKAKEFIGLVEMLDHMVWLSNADGMLEYFNKSWYEYTGLTEKQTREDRLQAIHPSQREKVKFQTELAWKKEKPYEVTLKLRRHDGEYQWFLLKAHPIKDAKGKVVKWLGTITNIHTHRLLEEALKLEVSALSEIIESIPQMACTIDAEGNTDYYNKRWYDYTHQTPEEALGWGWKNTHHPEDVEESLETFVSGLKMGLGFTYEARLLNARDNEYRWHLMKVTPVKDQADMIKYWIGTATDIHEQKMLEQNKGQFLNIASHELRTPLTTLMGYLELMEDALKDQNYKDLSAFLGKSSGSAQRMNRLVNDLLNLSSIDTGKIAEFHKEKLNIGKFIKDILLDYKQLHPDKEFHFNSSSSPKVLGNAFRLEQVMDNLISNAIKYAPGSPIYVEVKKLNDHVLISVKDKGEGIPEDKLQAIFDRFYRVRENSITSGLGVGLFITREIIEEHNGRIWAESKSHKGSTFRFTLPIAE